MRQYQIRITELTEADLENAGDYIAYELKNPSVAKITVNGIRAKTNSLINFPERNELDEVELLAGLGVRKIIIAITSSSYQPEIKCSSPESISIAILSPTRISKSSSESIAILPERVCAKSPSS